MSCHILIYIRYAVCSELSNFKCQKKKVYLNMGNLPLLDEIEEWERTIEKGKVLLETIKSKAMRNILISQIKEMEKERDRLVALYMKN